MQKLDYLQMEDQALADLLFYCEDRMEAQAAHEIASRDSLLPILTQLVADKQNWLVELPDWWAVVHATYIMGLRGGQEVIIPLLMALRWADAYDCDWVTEALPSIFGRLGESAIEPLANICRDFTAGWSVRDVAMKSLAAISLTVPQRSEEIFHAIGNRFMDDNEDRLLRQLAGQILLDFRCVNYRMALSKFAREEWDIRTAENWYYASFSPEDVEAAFRRSAPDTWHYSEDWMRFYSSAEIQRRQKRWVRERLGHSRAGRDRMPPPGGGRIINFWRQGQNQPVEPPAPAPDPEDFFDK